jgi:hypothetical protein
MYSHTDAKYLRICEKNAKYLLTLLNSSPSCGIAQPAQPGDEGGFTEWFAWRGYQILDV